MLLKYSLPLKGHQIICAMKFLWSVCLLLISLSAFAQPTTRRFPNSINNPAINVYAPFISSDGSMILFTSDYAELDPLVYFSVRGSGDWKQPEELPKHLNSKLNFLKGYTLSPNGKTIYIAAIKSGGVGGYDIWASDFKGSSWGELKNLYAPLNSKLHDASPTFTPDGSTMYFMRCEKMEYQKASGCKIFVTRKQPNGVWETPTELPEYINTGNSQTPRIMADGETLIFSSDKLMPNKGGMDLYVTKLTNSSWSNPIPLDIVNTEKNDQFVSALANGRFLLKEAPGKFRSEIVEYLLPEDVRPKGVMKIEGTVVAKGSPVSAYISVVDLKTQGRIFSGRPQADGSFFLFLKEGSTYELAVDPEDGSLTYYAKQYDLTKNEPLRNDQLKVSLSSLGDGEELTLEAIGFKPYRAEIESTPAELNRVARLIKGNPGMTFEIQVALTGYTESLERNDPDLTEQTTRTENVSLSVTDSTGIVTTRDSVLVKTIYHNNRTEQQAKAFVEALVGLGVNRDTLTISHSATPAIQEGTRNIRLKLIARKK
jgi:hypothetical protein